MARKRQSEPTFLQSLQETPATLPPKKPSEPWADVVDTVLVAEELQASGRRVTQLHHLPRDQQEALLVTLKKKGGVGGTLKNGVLCLQGSVGPMCVAFLQGLGFTCRFSPSTPIGSTRGSHVSAKGDQTDPKNR